jgi:hypothetical protein
MRIRGTVNSAKREGYPKVTLMTRFVGVQIATAGERAT